MDAWFPTPDRDAASLRLVNLLSVLREFDWNIAFGADSVPAERPGAMRRLQEMEIGIAGQSTQSIEEYLNREGSSLDLVILSRVHVASNYVEPVRRLAPGAKIVFDTTDLAFLRGFRGAKVTGNASLMMQALAAKRDELAAARAADCTLVVSPVEKEILESELPEVSVQLVSLIHPVRRSVRPFEERRDALFIGAFPHHPNVDAMRYFVDDVYPVLDELLDGERVFVIGSSPPDWLVEAASDRLIVTGHVPDLEPYLSRCKLTIAPLRYGSGVKGKVLLSMSHGVPVVASSMAAEGIPVVHGRDIMIGDDPASFVASIQELSGAPELWARISRGGLAIVREHFSFDAARKSVRTLLEILGLD